MILDSIPVVDLSPILGPYEKVTIEDYEKVTRALGDAMTGIGFAYLINHGVDDGKVDKVYDVSREFFALPNTLKLKYKKWDLPNQYHGYTRPGDELLNEANKNSTELREVWDVWGLEGYKDKNYPPDTEVAGFRNAFDVLRPDLENVSKKLFKCLGKYLNLDDDDYFVNAHRNLGDPSVKTQTQMRSMWYYTLDSTKNIPPNAIRCGEHSDWGSITLLFQDDVGGLEVKNVNGDWVQATPMPGAILLNSGQLMEFWSGGHFHAAPHRVRIITEGLPAKKPRQSFIYFVNPDGNVQVSPLVALKKGKEHFATKKPLVGFEHSRRCIADAMNGGY